MHELNVFHFIRVTFERKADSSRQSQRRQVPFRRLGGLIFSRAPRDRQKYVQRLAAI